MTEGKPSSLGKAVRERQRYDRASGQMQPKTDFMETQKIMQNYNSGR